MRISVNGKDTDIKEDLSLGELLAELGVAPEKVACELNLNVVRRKDFPNVKISANDRLEIIRMIGGG